MTKGYMATVIGCVVGLLMTVVGLVVLSDVHNARSSQVVPRRVLLASQDHSSVGKVQLEGRLEGEFGKFIQVKQSDCAIKLPFCSKAPCVVSYMRSEGLVHDQDDFAKVQIPMFVSAGMDMKTARFHMKKFGLDLGDLHAICEMTYAYNRFEYLMMFERTVSHEWSLQELANKMLQLDPTSGEINQGKQLDEKVLNMVRFGFERKNLSFDRSSAKKGYFSGVVLGDAQIHIAPGKVADAVADFLSRVEVEVSADVRYTDSSLQAIDGKASVVGPCSHKVNPRGGVQVLLPMTARGRVHMLSIPPALAKVSEEPQLAFEDRLNQASHAHSFEFINEPRSFVGDLFGVSHKVASNGVLNVEGFHIRDLQRMLQEDHGRFLQEIMTTQTLSIVFQEKLYLGDTTVNVSGILQDNGGPLKGKLTIGVDLENHKLRMVGTLAGSQSFLFDHSTKNWNVGMKLTGDSFETAERLDCELEDDEVTVTMTYVEATKALTGSIVVVSTMTPGTLPHCNFTSTSTETVTVTIGATFQDSIPAWPLTVDIALEGIQQDDSGTPRTTVPQTDVTYRFEEAGTTDTHKFAMTMASHTNTANPGEMIASTSQAVSQLDTSGANYMGHQYYYKTYGWSLIDNNYQSLPAVNVQSAMTMTMDLAVDKASTTTWGLTGNVDMTMTCGVVNDAALSTAATQAAMMYDSTVSDAITALPTNSDPRKYQCHDWYFVCRNSTQEFDCCLSSSTSAEDTFQDQTACEDAFAIGVMDDLGMSFGTSTETFTATMDAINTASEAQGHYKITINDNSFEINFRNFNDMTVDLVVQDEMSANLAVTNDWTACANNNCSQAVTFDILDGAGDPDFQLRVHQWNTKGVVSFETDGEIKLLGTATAPGVVSVRAVGTSYEVPDDTTDGVKTAKEFFSSECQCEYERRHDIEFDHR
jgi:hypothetical protein